jgi:hypothetical protein
MASMDFLGLQIESGSGLVFWFEYLIYMHVLYDDFSMDIMYMDY